MLDLKILQRQHNEISQVVKDIKEMLNHNSIDEEAIQIATKINMLAGKLKVHLATEDKYMYPYLSQSDNDQIRTAAKVYAEEMGHINGAFTDYKSRFNTRTKILSNKHEFLNETTRIFRVLEERISKEDTSLYKYII